MGEIVIVHLSEDSKFLAMDGDIQTGYLEYNLKDNTVNILTIYVDPEYRNRFLGKKLIDQCVGYAREKQFKILPICSYAAKVFKRTDKYDDVKVLDK